MGLVQYWSVIGILNLDVVLSCNFYRGFMVVLGSVCERFLSVCVQVRMYGLFQGFQLFHSFKGLWG